MTGTRKRTRGNPYPTMVLMDWWALDGPLTTRSGIAQLFDELSRELPEAIPVEWDVVEPPTHRFDEEGLDGLVTFLDRNREDQPWMWPRPPVKQIILQASSERVLGESQGLRCPWLHLEVVATHLTKPRGAQQLPRVFRKVAEVVEPFYAEARLHPDPASPTDFAGLPKFRPMDQVGLWFGTPQSEPMALAVGSPYLELWPEAQQGEHIDGFVLHSADEWPSRPEPLPTSPMEIRQEVDPHRVSIPWSELTENEVHVIKIGGIGVGQPHIRNVSAKNRPPAWPF
ncbi:MAG: hypothetical protein WB565_03510 [Acidimicrobiales bacterium]